MWPDWYTPTHQFTINDIIVAAARLSRFTPDQIKGAQRHKPLVKARFAVCYVARKKGFSYPVIGRRLGGRDHTTVMNAIEKAEIYRDYDPEFAAMLHNLADAVAA